MYGESFGSRSKKLLIASFAAVSAAEFADSASSWGKLEANPVLGRSRFGFGQTSIKFGAVSAILGGQHLLVRHHGPAAYKAMAIANFAAAGGLGYVAVHNSRIAPMPK